MSIQSIVSQAVGSATDSSYSTGIKDFISKFSDSSGKGVNRLNPLNTFEVCFKFHPTLDATSTNDNSWLKKLGTTVAKNAVNNITGGLLGSLNNDKEGVMTAHDTMSNKGYKSFMHYLTASNLLIGDENTWFGEAGQAPEPLELQLGYYVQSITVPMLKIPEGVKSITSVGEFPMNGTYVQPDNNQLNMDILNTTVPLIERIFYPWMREVTLPYWCYEKQPYTTATITIDFSKHTDLKYVFYGCRPQQLDTIQPNQENDQSFKRKVTFIFDMMSIQSKLTTMESVNDKLMNAMGTIANAGAGMLNM